MKTNRFPVWLALILVAAVLFSVAMSEAPKAGTASNAPDFHGSCVFAVQAASR